jgi:serpin B
LAGWLSQLSQGPRTVDVYLPKFKLSERYQLNDALTALGMTDAFDPAAANFTDMDGARDLFVSLVAHQAVLDVNETGTEAAAATEGVMAGAAEELAPTPVFRADHPFLFFIRDEATGTVLFLGRYVAPSG